jgi:hypothetical protein
VAGALSTTLLTTMNHDTLMSVVKQYTGLCGVMTNRVVEQSKRSRFQSFDSILTGVAEVPREK